MLHNITAPLHDFLKILLQIKNLGETNQLTNLVPNLNGVDPDDAFSLVPYEKGHTFLFYLEQLLGGPEVFEPFLKSYLDTYKYKSIKTDTWKNYLYQYFSDKVEVTCFFIRISRNLNINIFNIL